MSVLLKNDLDEKIKFKIHDEDHVSSTLTVVSYIVRLVFVNFKTIWANH